MYTQKQLIMFGLYAERAHRLAFDIALSSSELSQYGRGMAIVADETRNVGNKLYSLFKNDSTCENGVVDAVLQLKYLAVNGCLEMMRLHESTITLKKRLAVILDEIRNLTKDIQILFGIKQELPQILPRVAKENAVIKSDMIFNTGIRFVIFSIGGVSFCETSNNVVEVLYLDPTAVDEQYLTVRKQKLPIVNYYKKLSLDGKPHSILRVQAVHEGEIKDYAVLIDGLPEVFFSGIGVTSKPKGIPDELIRECWDCEEDLQMLFLDYTKFSL